MPKDVSREMNRIAAREQAHNRMGPYFDSDEDYGSALEDDGS